MKYKQNQTYKLKDISVIIPTMNRHADLLETLNYIPDTIKEIIIVDQSDIEEGDELWKEYIHKEIPVKIIRSEPPSITIARNKGLQFATGKLICYLDDDVTLTPGHFENMIKVINNHPESWGFAAWREFELSEHDLFIDGLKYLFTLHRFEEADARIQAPYCNTYPWNKLKMNAKPEIEQGIYVQWFPGMNMIFKKEVFYEMGLRFDENLLGYTIAEDIDFTYRLYKMNYKYKKNSKALVLDARCPIIHRDAKTFRQDPRKLAYINQIDHLYFAMKHRMIVKWWWNILGICMMRTLAAPFKYQQWLYFMESLEYCFINWSSIKQGRLREWKNDYTNRI